MIKFLVRTSVPSKFVVVTDTSAEVIQGTPEDLAILLSGVSPSVPTFLLMETNEFLLLETGDKIVLN